MAALKRAWELAKGTFKGFSDDEATWKAAALAYYTVFALPPLLVLLLQAASIVWDPIEVRRTLTGEFQALMGQDVGGQIQTMMASAEEKTSGTGLRLLLSIGGLVFGATGAFVSLQTALNRAWGVKPDPKRGGIRNFITKRFLSLGMVLGIAFLLLVSLALTAALSAAGGVLFGGMSEAVGHVLNLVFSFAVVTLLFAAIFKVLPDAKVAWRDVWVGAVATTVLFVIGKYLIGLYVGQSDPGNAFGAAGSLAVLLVWIYYAAVIVLVGAEFTKTWVRQRGRTIEPEEGAVRVVEEEIEVDEAGPRDGASRAGGVAGASASAKRPGDNNRSDSMEKEKRNDETPQDVRREMAETRAQMSETIGEVGDRVSDAVDGVKQKLDVVSVVREHPWPALAAAVVAGVALSATRADAKAAEATAEAAKSAAKSASRATADGAKRAVAAIRRDDAAEGDARDDGAKRPSARDEKPGAVTRAKSKVSELALAQANELKAELDRAADDLAGEGRSTPGQVHG